SDFERIIYDTKHGYAQNLNKIVMVGSDRIVVEVKDPDNLPDETKEKLKGSKEFWVARLQGEEFTKQLTARLTQLTEENPGLKVSKEEERFVWLGPMLMMLLLGALLLALFFFVLPRFRDPLGGGFLSNYIESPAKRYDRTKMRVTFDDVADMQNAKS